METCRSSVCFLGKYLSSLSVPIVGAVAVAALLYECNSWELSIFNALDLFFEVSKFTLFNDFQLAILIRALIYREQNGKSLSSWFGEFRTESRHFDD